MTPAEPDDDRGTAEVLASLVVNTQALVAREAELLGLELKRIAAEKLTALGALIAAATAGVLVLALGGVAAAVALEEVVPARWMAWAIVAGGIAVLSFLLVAIAFQRLFARTWLPRRTIASVTETAGWARDAVLGPASGSDGDAPGPRGAAGRAS